MCGLSNGTSVSGLKWPWRSFTGCRPFRVFVEYLCSILPDFNWQRVRAVLQRQLGFLLNVLKCRFVRHQHIRSVDICAQRKCHTLGHWSAQFFKCGHDCNSGRKATNLSVNKTSKYFDKRPNRRQKFIDEENSTARKSHRERTAVERHKLLTDALETLIAHVCQQFIGRTRLNAHRSWFRSGGRTRHAVRPNRLKRFGLKTDSDFHFHIYCCEITLI